MELTIDQGDLLRAARLVQGVVRRATDTMPVLANVLVEGVEDSGGLAVFVGTDLESLVRVSVAARVSGVGRLTVPADKLAEIAGVLPGGAEVRVWPEGSHVRIGCGLDEYDLVSLPADDFPEWVGEGDYASVVLPVRTMRRLLGGVLYALPALDVRRVLMGVLLVVGGDGVSGTATDGKKMSRLFVTGEVSGEARAVVPGKVLHDVERAMGGADDGDAVVLGFGERQVRVAVGGVEFRSNVIQGKYPDVDAVIPKEFRWDVRVNRQAMLLGAKRAGVTADEKSRVVILRFAGGRCSFSSMAADVGVFVGSVNAGWEGEDLELAFNVRLFLETLESFEGDELALCVADANRPVVVRCEADPERVCVLMPIRLADVRGEGQQ